MKRTKLLLLIAVLVPVFINAKPAPFTEGDGEKESVKESFRGDFNDIKTLAGNHNHSGGYGAIFFKATSFQNQALLMTGIRGAWVVNRSFGIGLDANGIIPTAKYAGIDPGGLHEAILVGGYGGILLEPVLWSNRIVHLTFPLSMGAGWLGYIEDWENDYYYPHDNIYDDDIFWYFEPGINVEINVAGFFRTGLEISRRFTQDLLLSNTSKTAFDHLSYGIILKFGGF
jgi:hypothetical protein